MTDEEIKAFLVTNRDDILAQVKKQTIDRLLESYKWSYADGVAKAVNEFIAEEIVPAVKADLQANKETYVAHAVAEAKSVGDALVKALAQHMVKTLSSEWDRRKVFEALLK